MRRSFAACDGPTVAQERSRGRLDPAVAVVQVGPIQQSDASTRQASWPGRGLRFCVALRSGGLRRTWSCVPGRSLRITVGMAELLADGSGHAGPEDFCWIRKITNSAGLTGAIPISQTKRPLSMSSGVIVMRSQASYNASAAVAPWKAPIRHRVSRNGLTDWGIPAHSGSPRLEQHPLGGLVDGRLDQQEQPAHADVSAVGVGAGNSGAAPHPVGWPGNSRRTLMSCG
jgi:hypothetical protein